MAPALDQASQNKLTEIKEKLGSLERQLERDVARNANLSTSNSQGRAQPDDADDDLPANEDEKDLEPTPLAVVDAAYEVDGEDDDLLDLGIQLGKMRFTERIGGFFRPKIAEEVCYAIFLSSFQLLCIPTWVQHSIILKRQLHHGGHFLDVTTYASNIRLCKWQFHQSKRQRVTSKLFPEMSELLGHFHSFDWIATIASC